MWRFGVALAASALFLVGIASAAPRAALDCTAPRRCVYLPLTQKQPAPTATRTATRTPQPPTATATATPTDIPLPTFPPATPTPTTRPNCDPAYPAVCIPPPPPDLDCGDIEYRRFTVLPPDPHGFDSDGDGIGCEGG